MEEEVQDRNVHDVRGADDVVLLAVAIIVFRGRLGIGEQRIA